MFPYEIVKVLKYSTTKFGTEKRRNIEEQIEVLQNAYAQLLSKMGEKLLSEEDIKDILDSI